MRKWIFLLLCAAFLTSCGIKKNVASSKSNYKRNITKNEYRGKPERKAIYPKVERQEARRKDKDIPQEMESSDLATQIIDYAKSYLGTKYRYGGMTRSGMDCSGLIYLSFSNAGDIFLPRSSREIAKQGSRIRRSQISKGDLLFFKTDPSRNVINHIGLVVETKGNHIQFIHSSTSRGVMISELDDIYWHKVFVEARRVL